MYPSADAAAAEQTILLGCGEHIRKGRGGSGARQWRSRREGGGIAGWLAASLRREEGAEAAGTRGAGQVGVATTGKSGSGRGPEVGDRLGVWRGGWVLGRGLVLRGMLTRSNKENELCSVGSVRGGFALRVRTNLMGILFFKNSICICKCV